MFLNNPRGFNHLGQVVFADLREVGSEQEGGGRPSADGYWWPYANLTLTRQGQQRADLMVNTLVGETDRDPINR